MMRLPDVLILFLALLLVVANDDTSLPEWYDATVIDVRVIHKPEEVRRVAGRMGSFTHKVAAHDEHYVMFVFHHHTRREFENGYTESKWTTRHDLRLLPEVAQSLKAGDRVQIRSKWYARSPLPLEAIRKGSDG